MDEADNAVRNAANGDQTAWRKLVKQHTGMLFAIGRGFRLPHEQIEDVIQDTWLQLYRYVGDLRDPSRLGGWLAITMRRGCIRARQRHDRDVLYGDWTRSPLSDPADDVETQLLQKEQNDLLWGAVRQLPTRQRDVVWALVSIESYAEIGAALGMPVGTIGPTRGRALRRLREQLGDGAVDNCLAAAS